MYCVAMRAMATFTASTCRGLEDANEYTYLKEREGVKKGVGAADEVGMKRT